MITMHKAESGKLLEECRELMTNRMRSSMARMMGYVEDVLFEMATVDSSTEEAGHYIEAVREIRMKKREIQVRFENRFMSLYQDSVRQMKSGKSRTQTTGDSVESLIGVVFQDSGDTITIKNTLDKVRKECRQALSILDSHVSTLFEKEKIDKFINPMQPVTVFGAFWESCRDLRAGEDIRFILVDMFERYVVADLHNVYDDLNSLFGFYNLNSIGAEDIGIENNVKDINSDLLDKDGEINLNRNSVLVRLWVKDRLEKKLSKHEVPDFIHHFLLESWLLVLEDVYEKFSDKSHEWERAMQVIDELIRCTHLAGDRETRTQQIWMLPGLIYRLKSGMKSISLPLKIQADFISALKAYHAHITELNLKKNVT
jgi:hypothetical protein